jgi:hypothetical protein
VGAAGAGASAGTSEAVERALLAAVVSAGTSAGPAPFRCTGPVMLQGPCVVAIVSELEPTGMAKHVGVDWEWHLGSLADALDEAMEADGAIGPPRSETNT